MSDSERIARLTEIVARVLVMTQEYVNYPLGFVTETFEELREIAPEAFDGLLNYRQRQPPMQPLVMGAAARTPEGDSSNANE